MSPLKRLRTPPESFRLATVLPLLLLVLLLFLMGCTENRVTTGNQERTCCQQCSAAAAQDPAGMDISLKQCRGYDERLDQQCREFFEESPMKVEECRIAR